MTPSERFAATEWLRLPVTAVRSEPIDDRTGLVMSGQGPYFVVSLRDRGTNSPNLSSNSSSSSIEHRHIRTHELTRSLVLPDAQPIHGIETCRLPDERSDGGIASLRWCALVWGGRAVRLLVLTAKKRHRQESVQGEPDPTPPVWDITIQPRRLEILDDWVFQIRFQPRNMPSPQRDCSEEPTLRAVVVTAHNSVREIKITSGSEGQAKSPSCETKGSEINQDHDWTITTIKPSSRCLLYSADVRWLDDTSALVVSGTCYGEIFVWICRLPADVGPASSLPGLQQQQQSLSSDQRVIDILPGHEGSIFGLSVSTPQDRHEPDSDEHLILSCSDDRMIHVWSVKLSKPPATDKTVADVEELLGKGHTGFEVRSDSIDNNDDSSALITKPFTSAWALQSRVWLAQSITFRVQSRSANSSSSTDDKKHIVLSIGEDATLHVWELKRAQEKTPKGGTCQGASLEKLLSRKDHAGKNIWAMGIDHHQTDDGDSLAVLTGGADGQIIEHRILDPTTSFGSEGTAISESGTTADWSIDEILSTALTSTDKVVTKGTTKDSVRAFDFVSPSRLVVTTNRGNIVGGELSWSQGADQKQHPHWRWRLIGQSDSLSGFSIVRACPLLDVVFIASSKPRQCVSILNTALAFQDSEKLHSSRLVNVSVTSEDEDTSLPKVSDIRGVPLPGLDPDSDRFVALLVSFPPPHHSRLVVVDLRGEQPVTLFRYTLLPQPSAITGGTTPENGINRGTVIPTAFAARYYPLHKTLLCFVGTRTGSTHFYTAAVNVDDTPSVGQSSAIRPFAVTASHAAEAVSGLFWRPRGDDRPDNISGWLFSTGRGGFLNVETVNAPLACGSLAEPSQVIAPVSLVHSLRLPLGPYVEGIVDTAIDQSQPSALSSPNSVAVYGFRKTRFVVLDLASLRDILSVECGGAHRVWTVQGRDSSVPNWSFCWIQSKKLNWWTPQTDSTGSLSSSSSSTTSVIQDGTHGREIKACCTTPIDRSRTLVATGSEDTDIKLFMAHLPPDSEGTSDAASTVRDAHQKTGLECVATLRHHTTGIQSLAWAPCAKERDQSERFLFSAGGVEELCAWRISPSIPHIGTGVVLASELPPLNGSEKGDIRVTDVHVSLPNRESTPDEDEQGRIMYEVLATTSDSQVHFFTFTCSRNVTGKWTRMFSVSYLTSCLTQVLTMPLPFLSDCFGSEVVMAGTDGHLICMRPDISDSQGRSSSTAVAERPMKHTRYPAHLQSRYRLHQSAVLAVSHIQLCAGYHFVVSGGDDNSLAFTLRRQLESSGYSSERDYRQADARQCATKIVPRAHSSSVKAICVISCNTTVLNGVRSADSNEKESARMWKCLVLSAGNDQLICLWEVSISLKSGGDTGLEIQRTVKPQQLHIRRLARRWTPIADVAGLALLQDPGNCNYGQIKVLVAGIGMEVLNIQM